jgi:hypothetical protein
LIYLDSSALVKLVLPEPESEPLFRALVGWPDRISSEIAAVEVLRAARRVAGQGPVLTRAQQVVDSVNLVRTDGGILRRAALADPPQLRSLDAIHLATAQSIDGVRAMVVYDVALALAAKTAGLAVLSPGKFEIPPD